MNQARNSRDRHAARRRLELKLELDEGLVRQASVGAPEGPVGKMGQFSGQQGVARDSLEVVDAATDTVNAR